jgi:hypothetical protein
VSEDPREVGVWHIKDLENRILGQVGIVIRDIPTRVVWDTVGAVEEQVAQYQWIGKRKVPNPLTSGFTIP